MVYVDRSEHSHSTAFAISAGSPKRPTRLSRLIDLRFVRAPCRYRAAQHGGIDRARARLR